MNGQGRRRGGGLDKGRATPVLRSKAAWETGNPDLTSEGNPPNTKQPSLKESNQRGEGEKERERLERIVEGCKA